jgi:hypothetical protein
MVKFAIPAISFLLLLRNVLRLRRPLPNLTSRLLKKALASAKENLLLTLKP